MLPSASCLWHTSAACPAAWGCSSRTQLAESKVWGMAWSEVGLLSRAAAGSQAGMQQRSYRNNGRLNHCMPGREKSQLNQTIKKNRTKLLRLPVIATDVSEASSGDEQVLVVQAGKTAENLNVLGCGRGMLPKHQFSF